MKNDIRLIIRRLRNEKKMSARELGEKMKCSFQAIYDYESGKTPLTIEKIHQFAEGLETSFEDLLKGITVVKPEIHPALEKIDSETERPTWEVVAMLKQELSLLHEQYKSDKEDWRSERAEWAKEMDYLRKSNDKLLAKY